MYKNVRFATMLRAVYERLVEGYGRSAWHAERNTDDARRPAGMLTRAWPDL
jgi:thioester reductase-like protein